MSAEDSVIELVSVVSLIHIESFSRKRVRWLANKIQRQGVWSVPIALDLEHNLVLDGQHRMEVAKTLGLKVIPAIRYNYSDIKVWSLRRGISFHYKQVIENALIGNIYPYKTVKHVFPNGGLPACRFKLEELL